MNNLDSIRTAVIDNATLCEFSYNGKQGNIDPGYVPGDPDSFLLWYAGKEQIVHSFDELLKTPFFNGKSLQEIAGQLTAIDW